MDRERVFIVRAKLVIFFRKKGISGGHLTFVSKKKCIFARCYDKKGCTYSVDSVKLGCSMRSRVPLFCAGELSETDVDYTAV